MRLRLLVRLPPTAGLPADPRDLGLPGRAGARARAAAAACTTTSSLASRADGMHVALALVALPNPASVALHEAVRLRAPRHDARGRPEVRPVARHRVVPADALTAPPPAPEGDCGDPMLPLPDPTRGWPTSGRIGRWSPRRASPNPPRTQPGPIRPPRCSVMPSGWPRSSRRRPRTRRARSPTRPAGLREEAEALHAEAASARDLAQKTPRRQLRRRPAGRQRRR